MAELRAAVADRLALTEDDLRAQIPSGTPLLANRLQWAVTYMYQAGLLSRPKRGVVRITDRGRKVAAGQLARVDNQVLAQFPEFTEFMGRSRTSRDADEDVPEPEARSTPREAVSAAVDEANVSAQPASDSVNASQQGVARARATDCGPASRRT